MLRNDHRASLHRRLATATAGTLAAGLLAVSTTGQAASFDDTVVTFGVGDPVEVLVDASADGITVNDTANGAAVVVDDDVQVVVRNGDEAEYLVVRRVPGATERLVVQAETKGEDYSVVGAHPYLIHSDGDNRHGASTASLTPISNDGELDDDVAPVLDPADPTTDTPIDRTTTTAVPTTTTPPAPTTTTTAPPRTTTTTTAPPRTTTTAAPTTTTTTAPPRTTTTTTAPPRTTTTTTPPPPPPPARGRTLLSIDYDRIDTGRFTLDDLRTVWGVRKGQGVSQGRISVGHDRRVGNYARHLARKGEASVKDTGGDWRAKFDHADEVFVEYKVLLEDGFSFGTTEFGGKMGGLMLGNTMISGGNTPTGEQSGPGAGGSVRLKFKENGKMVLYVYHVDKDSQWGQNFAVQNTFNTTPDFEAKGTPVKWKVGQWQTVKLRVEVNTPGKADGEIDVFIDGKHVQRVKGLYWRNEGVTWGVSGFMNAFFHGGKADGFAPTRDSVTGVADIRAWTE